MIDPHVVIDEIATVLQGKREEVELSLACLLAEGHLLLEDVPGVGKTTLAQSLAAVLGLEYNRIQFTNDIMPSDVLGGLIYEPKSQQTRIHRGPVFTQILLADELNRASAKAQSALLEAMEERQVSLEGESLPLPQPFFVLATQNPLRMAGTHPLPESQLDRFMISLSIGYPPAEVERHLYESEGQRKSSSQLKRLLDQEQIIEWQQLVKQIFVSSAVADYAYRLIEQTRVDLEVVLGISPRGGLSLIRMSKAIAWLQNRDHVLPDDIQRAWKPIVGHRLVVEQGADAGDVAQRILNEISVLK